MNNTIYIALIYGIFATIFHDTEMVGEFTMIIGKGNIAIFGYMAYIDFFLLAYLVHIFSKTPNRSRAIDILSGWILLFLSIVLIQPLLLESQNSGIVANTVYFVLKPIINEWGYALLCLSILALAVSVLIEEDNQFYRLYQELKGIQTYKNYKRDGFGPDIFEESIRGGFKNPFESPPTSKRNQKENYSPPPAKSKLERERERLRKLQESQQATI